MKALLLQINDRQCRCVSLGNSLVRATVSWSHNNGIDQLGITLSGLEANTREMVYWPHERLHPDDKVTISLVECSEVDPPTMRRNYAFPEEDGEESG